MSRKLDNIFKDAKRLLIDDDTKIVIMSDCHRGSGNNLDNFVKNQSIYEAALNYYYDNDFIYIELGDGDELWEVKDLSEIINVHIDAFKLLKKFNDSDRLIMIYGNHDISKKSLEFLDKDFYKYYDDVLKKEMDLLNGLTVYESMVLVYKNHDIFLIHGHQVDFFNSNILYISRFLVRYVWRLFEYVLINVPSNIAKNYKVENGIEKKLQKWSIKNNKMLIAGHTHRPIFPKIGQSLYFNDGSCIYSDGITCLEIEKGNISLIKWEFGINKNGFIYVKRKILAGNEDIISFYN